MLVVQRRIKPSEVAQTLAEVLGRIFAYAQRKGIPLAGQPLTRYLEWGPGVWTIEAGMRIGASPLEAITDPEIKAGTLPDGLVATSSGLWRAMSNAKRSTVTLHRVSSLDCFIAKKDNSVSWMDSFLRLGLVDEIRLMTAPVTLGDGLHLFGDSGIHRTGI